jgi:polar amino acid transport system substrate-binding protein
MPFEELVPQLEARKIDVIMSGMSIADSRRDKVRFVSPYLHMGQMALVRASDAARLSAPGALEHGGLRVGCVRGTTGELFARQNMSNSTCQAFGEPEQAVAQLRSGQLDVYLDDAPFVLQTAKDDSTLAAVPWLLTDEYLAWAVPRGADYDYLYDQLNLLAQRAKQRGDLQRIIRRYFIIEIRVK